MIRKCCTIPTLLTLVRLVVVPFVMIAVVHHAWERAAVLLGIAAITDVLDGAMARMLSQETAFGAFFDPFADKCLLVGAYSSIFRYACWLPFPEFFAWILVLREVFIACASIVGLASGMVSIIRPTQLGKAVMVAHCLLLMCVVLAQAYQYPWLALTTWYSACIVSVMMLVSLGEYWLLGYAIMRKRLRV